MIPTPITIEGKTGTVVYLDALWHPVPPERATMARVLFDDGSSAFFFTEPDTVEKFDPAQPRDKDGKWTQGLHLQGPKSKKPERLSTAEFEARYPEEKRLYLGVTSSAAAERAREGGGKIGGTGMHMQQSVVHAQGNAQREARDQGNVLRFAIKPEARVVRLPHRLWDASPERIDKWVTEQHADIVNVDDVEFIVKNPAMVAVDSHDYTLSEAVVLDYERSGYILDEYEAEKAALAALRQATIPSSVPSQTDLPPYQQARALLQDAVGKEIPVGVDDHPVAIRAAQEIAEVLKEMQAKGYTMPREIEVRAQQTQMPAGEATHDILQIKVPDNLPDDVTLDQATLAVYGEVDYAGVPNYVPRTFKEIVVHEMGHINRRPAKVRETPAAAKEFARELKAIHEMPTAAKDVSRYAAQNAEEFVAEVFTKLYRGDTVSPKVMRVYRGLRGGVLR